MTYFCFQTNLLASGGAESEIFIWDLNNHEKPMTPGAKSQVRTLNVILLFFVFIKTWVRPLQSYFDTTSLTYYTPCKTEF